MQTGFSLLAVCTPCKQLLWTGDLGNTRRIILFSSHALFNPNNSKEPVSMPAAMVMRKQFWSFLSTYSMDEFKFAMQEGASGRELLSWLISSGWLHVLPLRCVSCGQRSSQLHERALHCCGVCCRMPLFCMSGNAGSICWVFRLSALRAECT